MVYGVPSTVSVARLLKEFLLVMESVSRVRLESVEPMRG
jgi:hypothetical protein